MNRLDVLQYNHAFPWNTVQKIIEDRKQFVFNSMYVLQPTICHPFSGFELGSPWPKPDLLNALDRSAMGPGLKYLND